MPLKWLHVWSLSIHITGLFQWKDEERKYMWPLAWSSSIKYTHIHMANHLLIAHQLFKRIYAQTESYMDRSNLFHFLRIISTDTLVVCLSVCVGETMMDQGLISDARWTLLSRLSVHWLGMPRPRWWLIWLCSSFSRFHYLSVSLLPYCVKKDAEIS